MTWGSWFAYLLACLETQERMNRVMRQIFDGTRVPKCAGNRITVLYISIFSQFSKFHLWGTEIILGKPHKINCMEDMNLLGVFILLYGKSFLVFPSVRLRNPGYSAERNPKWLLTHLTTPRRLQPPSSAPEQGACRLSCTWGTCWGRRWVSLPSAASPVLIASSPCATCTSQLLRAGGALN